MTSRARSVTRSQVLALRWRAQQLDRAPGSATGLDDVSLLDLGVQDTGPVAARWALANRGLTSYDADATVLAWTLRVSPHLYRRTDVAGVVVATAPFSERDAAKRVHDASKPLRDAGVAVLDELATIARLQRELVAEPTVKGALSTAVTGRLDARSLRDCRRCDATHAWESPFRLAPLQAGLELEPDTSPPVLRRVEGLEPACFSTPGTAADPRLDVVRGYLRFYGPARPQDVAAFLDAAVADVRAHWPPDAVPVAVDGSDADRFVLAADLDALTAGPDPRHELRLLHPFDAWLQLRDRATLVPDAARRRDLWRNLGRPGAVVVDGEVVGTWRPRSSGRRLTLTWQPWARLPRRRVAAVEEQAQRLAEVRGQELGSVVADG
jgi:hypothetical protein